MRSRSSLLLSVVCSLGLACSVHAQDEADESDSPNRQGLIATYSAAGMTVARVDEAVAFDWQAASPDPRLPAGKFTATWRGTLLTQLAGKYELKAIAGAGKVVVKLADKELISGEVTEPKWLAAEPIELTFGYQPLEITFEQTGEEPRLALFWSGPNFVLEPIPERFLFHDRESLPSAGFERGRRLASALRCGACHAEESAISALPAPALDRLAGNIHAAWLVDWLASDGVKPRDAAEPPPLVRRMPHFDLSKDEAADVAAWLLRDPAQKRGESEAKPAGNTKQGKGKGNSEPSVADGERLFLTLGCLACHQHGELGESGLFGGGDLTNISAKRPADYFERWLADPASLNRNHRMPVFELSASERKSLALFLARDADRDAKAPTSGQGDVARGAKLVEQHRCGSCHTLPGSDKFVASKPLFSLGEKSDWSRSCAGENAAETARPGYRLSASDRGALKAYYTQRVAGLKVAPTGRDLLVELNCLACHAREGIDRQTNALPARLQDKLNAVVSLHDDLGKLVPAMTPPALNSVGDKLTDAAQAAAIRRNEKPHRPYLMVRMPKYNLTDEQLASLTSYFITTDRIPRGAGVSPAEAMAGETPAPQMLAAGPRLVTTDGFGCTSCHQVGSVLPDKAPLNARGPNLSLLERRIRREWFDRWCNSPARIVPRMEMPSVQIPVRGVLGDNLADQLSAVWLTLNTPGFEPPEPNPVRVLRLSGVPERKESPIVLHDVIKAGDKTYLFPLVIGLPNRHNILFDLETNRLAAWWLGDTARQRTKGKSWFWEAGGTSIVPNPAKSDLSIVVNGEEMFPRPIGQYHADLLGYSGTRLGLDERERSFTNVNVRLNFDGETGNRGPRFMYHQLFQEHSELAQGRSGFERTCRVYGIGDSEQIRLAPLHTDLIREARWDHARKRLQVQGSGGLEIEVLSPDTVEWHKEGYFSLPTSAFEVQRKGTPFDWIAKLTLRYSMSGLADQFVAEPPTPVISESTKVLIAPGFDGQRLPLPIDMMPTGLAWKDDDRLLTSSLKGQIYEVIDFDHDGLEEKWRVYADGLATSYGLFPRGDNEILVAVKGGIVNASRFSSVRLASGWGATDDYHDWAIGPVPDGKGGFYVALPCQQDQRSESAAKHRGQILHLTPMKEDAGFDLEVISSGHRFPMGMARNRDGELFVTDNQGNYNPFNELNHVRPGAHFGFINALEKDKGFKPPRHDKPAIDIPHPWTRSVNGICFLDTPAALREETGKDAFGPLEGHLVGCEYDTRQLIRMTLQKVGDTYQGAAYPLSIPPENVEDGLLGPIVCAVSPRGELYVGNIRDSGWGAGNNVGDIVQIKIEPDKLPCGIAEVRATKEGFTIDFFRPVDPAKAKDAANYSIASYRRESTPAYGGPNLDRRTEKIAAIELSPDAKRVTLKLADLRPGFLYEFQLKPLVRGKELFHPAEAHYTLNQIP